MLQAGKSVIQKDDLMVKVKPEYLYHAVKNPKPETEALIRQLRLVRTIDEKRYNLLKRNLPYVTCGIFNPPVRRTENFAWISHFMIDIDHVTEKQMDISGLRLKLSADPRVKLFFLSPGEDGLKVMFQFTERCCDAGIYSLFYKLFARKFSDQYQLDQVVDFRTSDVTRACFVSYDPDAYYNPAPDTIQISDWMDLNNPLEVKELQHEIREEEKKEETKISEKQPDDPDSEALAKIKAVLNPKLKIQKEKIIFVPQEIETSVDKVMERMKELGISIYDVTNIHYGKKFRFRLHLKEAEINLFYGKRGYTVVQTPRQGTNHELNEVCAAIMNEIFNA